MRTFSRTSQFKKDVKRLEKRGKTLGKLRAVIDLIIAGHDLPAQYLDHPLRGNYVGSRDCHVEPDWILIYTLEALMSASSAPARTEIYFSSAPPSQRHPKFAGIARSFRMRALA